MGNYLDTGNEPMGGSTIVAIIILIIAAIIKFRKDK